MARRRAMTTKVMDYELQCILADLLGQPKPSWEAYEAAKAEEAEAGRAARILAARAHVLREFPRWMRPYIWPADATASEAGKQLEARRQVRGSWCAWCGGPVWSRGRRIYCSPQCRRKAKRRERLIGWDQLY
jgi:hypothetical protein